MASLINKLLGNNKLRKENSQFKKEIVDMNEDVQVMLAALRAKDKETEALKVEKAKLEVQVTEYQKALLVASEKQEFLETKRSIEAKSRKAAEKQLLIAEKLLKNSDIKKSFFGMSKENKGGNK